MKIFVISRRRALERRDSVIEQFEKIREPFEFFDAIETIRGTEGCFHGVDEQIFRLNTYRSPLPGEIGCYASHVMLWNKAVEMDEPILILEDDCHLKPNFNDAVAVAEMAIEDFGFIRLEGFERDKSVRFTRPSHVVSAISGFDMHYLSNVPLCLLAYVISPRSAARLIAASRLISSPIDKFIQRTWDHRTPIFALAPSCVGTASLACTSTIGNRRSCKKRELGVALRRAAYKFAGEVKRRQFDHEQLALLRRSSASHGRTL